MGHNSAMEESNSYFGNRTLLDAVATRQSHIETAETVDSSIYKKKKILLRGYILRSKIPDELNLIKPRAVLEHNTAMNH